MAFVNTVPDVIVYFEFLDIYVNGTWTVYETTKWYTNKESLGITVLQYNANRLCTSNSTKSFTWNRCKM